MFAVNARRTNETILERIIRGVPESSSRGVSEGIIEGTSDGIFGEVSVEILEWILGRF